MRGLKVSWSQAIWSIQEQVRIYVQFTTGFRMYLIQIDVG